MSSTENEIKYVALDHARSLNDRYQVATVAALLENAKKIEAFIRDGGTAF